MSLSGDEVAQCLLEGCQLVLKSSPLGLSLHWLVTEDGKRKLHGTSCLSSVQVICGLLSLLYCFACNGLIILLGGY